MIGHHSFRIEIRFRKSTRHARRMAVCGTILLLSLPAAGQTLGGQARNVALARPQDAIWLIDTRHIGSICGAGDGAPDLAVWQLLPNGRWARSSIAAFRATDDTAVITTVYVHGNRVESGEATAIGLSAYRIVSSEASDEVRLRHVIWSWPSERVCGVLRDFQAKSQRTLSDSHYLARVVSGIHPEIEISLIGYSFGASIVTGAAHLVGGGTVAGRSLPVAQCGDRRHLRVVAIAAAMDNDALLPNRAHGEAIHELDRMLLVYNSCDPVLRRYYLAADGHPHALGFTGLVCPYQLGKAAKRIDEMDAAWWIGRTHDWDAYARSTTIVDKVRRFALWE
jgi:hypothetical protein